MNRSKSRYALSLVLSSAALWAQSTDSANAPTAQAAPTAQQTPAPVTPPPTKSPFTKTIGGHDVNFSGSVDVYYSFNNNHPGTEFNQLYNFDDKTNQFNLNMAKITASMDPAPIGFRIDLGLGRVFDNLYPYGTPNPGFMRYSEQAYVSIKPKQAKGFEADLGQFVTSAGADVIESKDNWNYSRSLLFSWGIPYYHFGLRTSMPIGSSFTAGFQLVNGWNSVINEAGKNMQTIGLTGALTRKKFTWSNNFYNDPNVNGINEGRRSLYDTTLLLTPTEKFNAFVNFDYARQSHIGGGSDHITGVAFAARYQINKFFAVTPRFEVFDDPTGFSTGTAQRLHEITLTGEYKIVKGLLSRVEYRHDGSDTPFFLHGAAGDPTNTQSTFTIALIAYFAP